MWTLWNPHAIRSATWWVSQYQSLCRQQQQSWSRCRDLCFSCFQNIRAGVTINKVCEYTHTHIHTRCWRGSSCWLGRIRIISREAFYSMHFLCCTLNVPSNCTHTFEYLYYYQISPMFSHISHHPQGGLLILPQNYLLIVMLHVLQSIRYIIYKHI